jgi:hypothetical protein
MKRAIQFFLSFILIISVFFFFNKYFYEKKKKNNKLLTNNIKVDSENQNIIKNLKYEILVDNQNSYKIFSENSVVDFTSGSDIVKMNIVDAEINIRDYGIINISSEKAIYNNGNYYTEFIKNVKIQYDENVIFSDQMELDFKKKTILIFNNVIFENSKGRILTDNIKIDLLTKKANMYMNRETDKVNLIQK